MIFLILQSSIPSLGQIAQLKISMNGFVHEKGSSETLPGVIVAVPSLQASTITNAFGFYTLSLPLSDSLIILFSCAGYQQQTFKVPFTHHFDLSVDLEPDQEIMAEVIIHSQQKRESESVQMSTINIPISQMKDLPGLLGEKDMLKVLQLMPGVQKGREGNSGLYVRGGGPDQNLILLDGATIYNAFHLFGFYSLFNGDALKSVELTKGGFPARYGGRLSSVVEMNMKDGNKEKMKGEASVGIISSKLTLEVPIVKNKSSLLISARRTYLDLLVTPFLPKDRNGSFYFFDLNSKFNFDIDKKNKIFLSSYWGGDQFNAVDMNSEDTSSWKGKLKWGNTTGTARWNHVFSNKIFSNTSFVFSRFNMKGEEQYKNNGYQSTGSFSSFIQDLSLKSDLEFHPNPVHNLRAGIALVHHAFNPVATSYVESDQPQENNKTGKKTNALEGAIYLEDTYKPLAWLKMNAGVRISYYNPSKTSYLYPEPRLSASFHLSDQLSIKTSYSLMYQYLHLLSYTKIGLPADLWVPATATVKPQKSQQLALGIARDFPNQNLYLTVESYYKKSENVIAYKSGANYLSLDDDAADSWENKVTVGKGWSYGVEFLLHKQSGRFSGWVAYTLSWSKVQFASLNQGKKYFSPYDRRNDVSLVFIYKPNSRITVSSTWVYGSGNRITLPMGTFPGADINGININDSRNKTFFTEKNGYQLPAYHRLDLGIQFHKKYNNGIERTWEIGLYNAYSRQNPYFYYIAASSENNINNRKLKQMILFPILPSVSYKIKF